MEDRNYKAEAIKNLAELRLGSLKHVMLSANIRNIAKEGKFTLEDIFTSEAELEDLRKKGCLLRAQNWTDYLFGRKIKPDFGPINPDARVILVDLIDDELKLGGLTYTDLGISKEEILHQLRGVVEI